MSSSAAMAGIQQVFEPKEEVKIRSENIFEVAFCLVHRSEYWKSNPRKFCDFCKCWIADNKPSIEFHERGKRHKESVQKRLAEMGRKGQEEYEAKLQEEDFLKAMEEAALKAYKADIEKNPDITGTTISEIAKASNAELVVGKKKGEVNKTEDAADSKKKDDHKPKVNVWHEAASPEGQSYYWNVETGESSWEAPAEGYLSLTEQKELKRKKGGSGNKTNNTADNSSGSATKDTKVKKQKSGSKTSAPSIFGPAPKVEAYSTWQTIQREPEKKQVDLQLPKVQQDEYYGPELVFEKPVSSFQEKIVKLKQGAGEGGSVTFKKRKGTQDNSKIMKRRNDL